MFEDSVENRASLFSESIVMDLVSEWRWNFEPIECVKLCDNTPECGGGVTAFECRDDVGVVIGEYVRALSRLMEVGRCGNNARLTSG